MHKIFRFEGDFSEIEGGDEGIMTLAELATSKLKLLQCVFVHLYLHVLLYRKPVLIVWGVPGKCRKSLGENGHLIQNYGGPHEKYGGPPQTSPKSPP